MPRNKNQYRVASISVNRSKLIENKGRARSDWADTFLGVRKSLLPVTKNQGDQFEIEASKNAIEINDDKSHSKLQIHGGDTSY